MSKRLAECQRVIGYHFANPGLLEIALTHSSVRTPDRECNERQEFLGDSVLGLAITEELYKRLPDQQEGELTRIKSAVVSRGALYRVSMRLGLPRFVEVAKGVGRREELPVSLTANLVESIIGAIYLDAGFFPAREFILRHLGPEVEDVMNDRVPKNYKSLLQHEAQQILGATPVYRTLEEEGPDHRKAFTVAAVVRGTEYGRASGINKKEAEQEAARHALDALTRRGRGRRRRPEARGEGGRGEARRGREEARPLVRQTSDDDAWRAWAEREARGGAGAPAAGAAPAPAPGGPYVVGPEPEEAWAEESAPAEGAVAETPPPAEAGAPAPEAGASEGAAKGEGETRPRRHRGRRGGRRRRGEGEAAPPAAQGAAEEPAAPEEPDVEAVPEEGGAPAPKAAPEPARARARARGPRERPERRRERPPAPPPPAASPEAPARSTDFGKGVLDKEAPPPALPHEEPDVTPIGAVEAVKKAPVKPKAPPAGGFGAGLG